MRLSARLARVLVATALCAVPPMTSAAADPPIAVCVPDGSACLAAEVTPRACDGATCLTAAGSAAACLPERTGCFRGDVSACPPGDCTAVRADVCTADVCLAPFEPVEPLGGIEQPATGTITIHETTAGVVTTVLTGVFDPAAGDFTCTTYAPVNAERTVRCVPNNPGIDWYCAGWVVTATTHIYNAQAAGQASCSDYQGFPGNSSYQTLWTDFACCAQTKTATAYALSWFVDNAITCQAWGYSAGPHPMGEYTVTCNEPGANAPR